jgi:mRNA-degrading endonuclease RelE of RelBE toxin-antitoxin system
VIIAETPTFTRQVRELLDEESYRQFQLELVDNPDRGRLIPGSGGLRKIRWHGSGRGKRGGVRVIYYWATEREIILLLLAYPKNDREDLTPAQLAVLRRVVEEEFK